MRDISVERREQLDWPSARPNKARRIFFVAVRDTWQWCFRQLLKPLADVIYTVYYIIVLYDVFFTLRANAVAVPFMTSSPCDVHFFVTAPRNERVASGLSTMFHVDSYL